MFAWKTIQNTDFLKKHPRCCRATGEHWRALASISGSLSSNWRALASTGEQMVMLGELQIIPHICTLSSVLVCFVCFSVFWLLFHVLYVFHCFCRFCVFLRRYAKNDVRTVAIDVLGYLFPCGLFLMNLRICLTFLLYRLGRLSRPTSNTSRTWFYTFFDRWPFFSPALSLA